MAKTPAESDALTNAATLLLGGLGLKSKQNLIERNDRMRLQFLQTQKIAATKARERQLDEFIAPLLVKDSKIRDLTFHAWLKEHGDDLGEVPTFPDRYLRENEGKVVESEEEDAAATKEATATLKKWLKAGNFDAIEVYTRLGPYELPAAVLKSLKRPAKASAAAAESADGKTAAGAPAPSGPDLSAVVAEQRAELDRVKAKAEAEAERSKLEIAKLKQLLEENKEGKKKAVADAIEPFKEQLKQKDAALAKREVELKRDSDEARKAKEAEAEKVIKLRDEIKSVRDALEKAERQLTRASTTTQTNLTDSDAMKAEKQVLQSQLEKLQTALKEVQTREAELSKYKARYEQGIAAAAITSSENARIWEDAIEEKEVKEAFQKKFNIDVIDMTRLDHDERDLSSTWRKLIEAEKDLVERFFAIPFRELQRPSDEFKELITGFIELKDSLVAREQLSLLINFVGARYLKNVTNVSSLSKASK